ncbi:aminoacyl-tRNA hydrolase [candidate division KSB1 bacterium]|nr:aminoacyl-tRNA hydrolase [candidate division KSB1 bacterium]
MIKLITFLGNPGRNYQDTRHNFGWEFATSLTQRYQLNWQQKFQGVYASQMLAGQKVYFLKPTTFMNVSGKSVQALVHFYQLETDEILVAHDDVELDFGQIGIKKDGGMAGHNGLRSIAEALSSTQFYRLRLGIGRPAHGKVAAFVLSAFSEWEQSQLPRLCNHAITIFEACLQSGIESAAREYAKTQVLIP